MCGIAGLIAGRPVNRRAVQAMNDLMAHRGPDGEGLWSSDDACIMLGHRRLAIIDPTPAGHQPMVSADGRLVLTFNGEIYNYIELAERLKAEGRQFASASDTEVLMAVYEAWGEAGLDQVNGMFAFALYDRDKERLFCARDRFGEKPLLYVTTPEFFAFASEYKALLALAEVAGDVDETRLLGFLHQPRGGLDDDDETVFSDIKQLLPGAYLSVDAKTLDVSRGTYWQPGPDAAHDGITETEAVLRFKALLSDSVKIRMRSDVPVGSCLSGGLDSGAIVCLNRQHVGDGPAYHVFTGRFPGTASDEWPYAQEVIGATQVTSHVTEPSPQRLLEEMPEFVWHNELPVGSTSQYAQWCVFRLAAENDITVLLDGQGADELLGGYEQYFAPYLRARRARDEADRDEEGAIRERYPAALLSPTQAWSTRLPQSVRHRLANMFDRGSDFLFGLDPEVARRFGGDHSTTNEGPDALTAALRGDAFHAQLPTLLRYGDRNSMAHSREVRLPFCDHRIAELILSLPPHFLMGEAQTKRLLREAMRGVLPDTVRTRWNKQGFLPPQADWLAGPLLDWMRAVFASPAFAARGYWNVPWWRRAVERFIAGERHLAWSLWKPLMAEAWAEHFVQRCQNTERHSVFAGSEGGR